MENWCHGVLSFDLRVGGIAESHKSNILNVKFFRDVFNQTDRHGSIASGIKANNPMNIIQSPFGMKKKDFRANSINSARNNTPTVLPGGTR